MASARQDSKILYVGVASTSHLGYFKYRNFSREYRPPDRCRLGASAFVPLAISFFTFQQIAFWSTSRTVGHVDNPTGYVAFVALFQPIAGPIVLYREIEHQFAKISLTGANLLSKFAKGLFVFAIDSSKRSHCRSNRALCRHCVRKSPFTNILEAWAGAVAYSPTLLRLLVIPMAVGLGLMLGLTLPFNFDVPFRSTSMIVFPEAVAYYNDALLMMYLYSPIALAVMR